MSFPLVSIAIYNSVVFGIFSNTQRFISEYRYGNPSRPPALVDLALASMAAGTVSVGIGGPVDLVKIRLQMQTQTFLEGMNTKFHCYYISFTCAFNLPDILFSQTVGQYSVGHICP